MNVEFDTPKQQSSGQLLAVGVITTTPTLTAAIVNEAITACEEFTKADAAQRKAKARKEEAVCRFFEVVAGIKTLDELSQIPPDKLNQRITERMKNKLIVVEPNCPDAIVPKPHVGRYPAWKDQFEKVLGTSKVNEVMASTPESYSYRVNRKPKQ